jgi:hypothetical protein
VQLWEAGDRVQFDGRLNNEPVDEGENGTIVRQLQKCSVHYVNMDIATRRPIRSYVGL